MKVNEFLKNQAEPRGDSGYSVDPDEALKVSGEMRQILNLDLEEVDIACAAYLFNNELDSEVLIAAWEHLNAGERRAWREYVRRGKCS